MEKVFKSKVDIILSGLSILPIVLALFIFIYYFFQYNTSGTVLGIVIFSGVIAFAVHLYLTTYYTIKGSKLIIKSSFLVYHSIDIQSIKQIKDSNSWEKAPALSLDRLEIKYNEKPAVRYNFYDYVIISPENKEEFINSLLEINPEIEIFI